MINHYPYTDAHELNLDYILKKIKELDIEFDEFKVLNSITFSGSWDITKQYPAWALVEYNGNAGYISIKPVPAGVLITNTDYWALVADYSVIFASINKILNGRSYLNNKNVVVYGDSTVYKDVGVTSYMDIVAEIGNCSVENRAVPGTRMRFGTNNGIALINASNDLTDFDVIFLCYGTNEWQSNETREMLRYDVELILAAIQNKNPNLEIYFVNPFYSYRNNWGLYAPNVNPTGLTLEDVNTVIQDELRNHSVNFIDLYHTSSCNAFNYSKLLENNSGVYVHALDDFKKEIAALILKGPASRDNNKSVEDLLFAYDFVDAQIPVTLAEYAAGNPNGICIHITGGTNTASTYKSIDNRENTEYILCGTTDAIVHIAFAGKLWDTGIGDFEFHFELLSAQDTQVVIGADTDANVSGLRLIRIASLPLGSSNLKDHGRCVKFVADNVTFTKTPSISLHPNAISIHNGVFTVSSTLAAFTDLFHTDSDVKFIEKYGMIFTVGSGALLPVQFAGSKVRSMSSIPAGTYCLIDQTLTYPYNESMLF